MHNTPIAPNLEQILRQAYQTPFTTDVVEPSQQKPAKTTCFLDLATHRFHDHLASGVQGFPLGRLHFCGHTRLRCSGLLRHGRPWIMMALTPGGHGRIESVAWPIGSACCVSLLASVTSHDTMI